jgi:hypothetical protein
MPTIEGAAAALMRNTAAAKTAAAQKNQVRADLFSLT